MRKQLLVAALALVMTGCANPNGGPPASGYSIFYSQADHLKDLVAKRSFDEAVKLIDDQDTYFSANAGKVEGLLSQAAIGYNESWQPKIDEAIAKASAVSWPQPREKWAQARSSLAFARSVLYGYGDHRLTVGPRRAEGIGALQQVLAGITQRIASDAPAQLRSENLASGRNFFADFPVSVDIPGVLVERMKASFDPKGDDERIFTFARAYSSWASQNRMVKEELNREVEESFRQKAKTGSIQQIVMFYKRTLGASIAPKTIPVSVAVYTASAEGAPFPVTVSRDIPFDWKTATSLGGGSQNADFIMAVGPTRASLNRKVGSYNNVNSSFLAGYQSVPNPDYQTAMLNMQRAQQLMANARTQQITASNDVICNQFGCQPNGFSQLAASLGMIAATEKFNNAQAQLQSTPQTVQKPVYQPYTFETAVISTSKSAELAVFVGRAKGGIVDSYTKALDSAQNFTLAYKAHEKDQGSGRSSSYVTEAAVDAWEKQAVTASLVAMIAEGSEKHGASWQQASAAFDRKAFASNLTQPKVHGGQKEGAGAGGADRRFGSVVVIRTADSIGSGFFVTSDVILTNEHVVGRQSFITMKTYEGADINGKVITTDKRRDLALIKSTTPSVPVKMGTKEITVGAPVEVVGHPQGLQYTLTRGIVSQVRAMPPASGVGSGLVSYVQLDASISPGNSGGPVYQDGAVIGVATWKVNAKATENLNFAVHRDEVASFLRENGVSP